MAKYLQNSAAQAEDIELALDAAHKAKAQWNKASPTTRSNLLLKIADRLEANLEMLAVAETWDNGKPVRETLAADIPLIISVILQAVSARKKAAFQRLMKIPLPTIFMNL
jgi:acyl-CoA reductase-like NAD-dependent aldehyde dehydrogenase